MTAPTSLPQNTKSPGLAALASALAPGLGHLYTGRQRVGRRLLTASAVLFVMALMAVLFLQLELAKMWVDLDSLVILMLANIAVLTFRGAAALNAYDSAGSSRGFLTYAGAGVAALLIVAPHAVFGHLVLVQHDLVSTVFVGSEDPRPPVAGGTTEPDQGPGISTPETDPTQPAPSDPAIWDGLERLNVVLLGADAGSGRTGLRTDTTIVISIDPETGDAVMLSVPRNLSAAPLPEGMGSWDCNCFPDLITHLYDAAERSPGDFPGPAQPPINALKAALGEIFGIPIHYYALVTLDGFVAVVDAFGGVDIDVPVTIVDETYPHEDGSVVHIEIPAGRQHLDGHHALAYARIRRHADDFARMHRQRCVLEAVVEQSSPAEIIFRYGSIAQVLKDHLSTDIPQDQLPDFIDLLPRLSTDRIATLRITEDDYKTGEEGLLTFYDLDRIKADAQALMTDPEAAQESLELESLDTTCE